MRAWLVCLNDAKKYIALAQNIGSYQSESSVFQYPGGAAPVNRTIQKGLLTAALLSVGQVFGSGRQGRNIEGNGSHVMVSLRKHLLNESDIRNGWETGRSQEIINDQVKQVRDKTLAHFDGDVSSYEERLDPSDGSLLTFWNPPNPYLEPDGFGDLARLLYEMEIALKVVFYRHLPLSPSV